MAWLPLVSILGKVRARNTNSRGRLSTVDLLIKVGLVLKEITLATSKAADLN